VDYIKDQRTGLINTTFILVGPLLVEGPGPSPHLDPLNPALNRGANSRRPLDRLQCFCTLWDLDLLPFDLILIDGWGLVMDYHYNQDRPLLVIEARLLPIHTLHPDYSKLMTGNNVSLSVDNCVFRSMTVHKRLQNRLASLANFWNPAYTRAPACIQSPASIQGFTVFVMLVYYYAYAVKMIIIMPCVKCRRGAKERRRELQVIGW